MICLGSSAIDVDKNGVGGYNRKTTGREKNIPLRRTVSFQAPASDRDKNGNRIKLKGKWKSKIIPFMRSFLTIRDVPKGSRTMTRISL